MKRRGNENPWKKNILRERRELVGSKSIESASLRHAAETKEIAVNQQEPAYIYEGLDPATGEFGRFSKTVMNVYHSVSSAFNRAREPGKPLATVANLTREAPLGSLFVAFVLGVAFATRHVNRR